ncbi:MAG: DUF4332 domain-containing protein [Saprospiraceae bacterium]|nr:DUF4332 domain-containing protein [Saprospiraceae bacterium]
MAYKIIEIEGIGEVYAGNLAGAGITTVEQLLEAGASKKGRTELAATTGISESLLLRWVNMADMFRIKGVAEEFSDLLELAGVDTVKELRTRNAENLHAKLTEVNAERGVAGRVPRMDEVQSWIEQAGQLDPKVTH